MEELIKELDENLQYQSYEICGREIKIQVKSLRIESFCPHCGKVSSQVHSRTTRTIKDLPIQGKKVKILLSHKKYFCKNKECRNKTFAERFAFYSDKATKTNRLQEEILRVSLTQSSIAVSQYLRSSVTDVGKSTICNLLKEGSKQCGNGG